MIFQAFENGPKKRPQKSSQTTHQKPTKTPPRSVRMHLNQASKTVLLEITIWQLFHNLRKRSFPDLEQVSGTLVIYIYILKRTRQRSWALIPINSALWLTGSTKSDVFRWDVRTFWKITDAPIRVDRSHCHTSVAKSIVCSWNIQPSLLKSCFVFLMSTNSWSQCIQHWWF